MSKRPMKEVPPNAAPGSLNEDGTAAFGSTHWAVVPVQFDMEQTPEAGRRNFRKVIEVATNEPHNSPPHHPGDRWEINDMKIVHHLPEGNGWVLVLWLRVYKLND